MKIEILIIGAVIVLILLLVLYSVIISRKKLKRSLIKIDIADEDIDVYLDKKYELFHKSKNFIEDKEYLNDFNENNFNELDHFEKNDLLDEYNNILQDKIYEDDDLLKNKDLSLLVDEVRSNNNNLNASIKYYNNSVEEYLKISKTFPTKLVRLFCGIKKYNLYKIQKKASTIY